MQTFRKQLPMTLFILTMIFFGPFLQCDASVMAATAKNGGDNPNPRVQDEQTPTPITVRDAEKIFDARRFPAPGGVAAESYSTAAMGIYKIDDEMSHVTNQTKKAFETSGWEIIKFDDATKNAVMLQVTKEGLLVSCSISKQDKSPIQLFLNVLGNVDLSQLPKAKVESIEHDRIDFSMYRSELNPEEVVSFYDDSLGKKGWQRYESFNDHGLDSGEQKRATYRFHGVSLILTTQPADKRSQVMISVSLLQQDVPTPAGVSELRLDANLFRQSFRSDQSVSDLLKYFVSNLKLSGRIMLAGRVFKNEKAAMFLTHPSQEPIFLEIVSAKKGGSRVYMGSPTRQVTRAMKSSPEFEIAYDKALPMSETQMHRLPYQDIPFHQPLPEGSGRTIAESVFYNTKTPVQANFSDFDDFFTKRDWTSGKRENEFIGDKMTQSSIKFAKADAEIIVTSRPWADDSIRINIKGNGIQWPGNGFCQMLARDEAEEIQWSMIEEPAKEK